MTASLDIRVIRSSLVDWRPMKKKSADMRGTSVYPGVVLKSVPWRCSEACTLAGVVLKRVPGGVLKRVLWQCSEACTLVGL